MAAASSPPVFTGFPPTASRRKAECAERKVEKMKTENVSLYAFCGIE
ncbi:MAG TPA: hypothetical protein GXZ40_05245 [Bacteroidales bacterium]|nr:hypothetical protein [Bacteroidales bacterium]